MSEYTLFFISTICGVVGASAYVAIVILMIRGEPQRVGQRRYWPWILALALVTVATATPAYPKYGLATGTLPIKTAASSSEATPSDLRLAPLAAGSRFLSGLQPDTKETVWFFCYPFDPMSCNIARQYRNRFQGYWTLGFIQFPKETDPDFSGINIAVRDVFDPPPGATALKKELLRFGINAEIRVAPSLQPNVFEVWIGRKP